MKHQLVGKFDFNQLKEVMRFLERQETSDRLIDTTAHLTGVYGDYYVNVYKDGHCKVENED